MRFTSRLLMADPADGNGPADHTPAPQSAPTIPAAPMIAPPSPPAAAIVSGGKRTEADIAPELEAKKLQSRIAQLEDENRTLKQVPSPVPPAPVAAQQKKSWLEGGSFFD